MSDETSLCTAWEAIQRFVHDGNVSANLSLYQQLQDSLGGETWIPKPMMHTLAPRLLQYSLENYKNGSVVGSSILSFVSILNRMVCLKLLPAALARPLDRRPTGLRELAEFYQDILLLSSSSGCNSSSPLLALTRRQLIACWGCLLVLLEDNIADTLRALFMSVLSSNSTTLSTLEDVFQVFLSVIDILSDDRVPIGPIRRATQRKHFQNQLDMLLFPIPTVSENLACLQAEAVAKGIEFLTLGTVADPQKLATDFWHQLPSSSLWHWALCHLNAPNERLATTSQKVLCGALRSLNIVNPTAEQLIFSALTTVLSDTNTIDVVASCRIITSSMESTTEHILLHCKPNSSIFSLLSSVAEYLLGALSASSNVEEEAVKVVCEGVSALVQGLTPAPLPAAEPTDDPEDFIELIESINRENEQKKATAEILQGYFCRCQRELGVRLVAMTSSPITLRRDKEEEEEREENRAAITSYALEHIKDEKEGVEDFQVAFDNAAVSIFTAYERLCSLLGSLPLEITAERQITPALAVVAASALASIRVISAVETPVLLEQATLLPLLSARYAKSGRIGMWSEEEIHFFIQRLVDLLEVATEADLTRLPSILSTLADTLVDPLQPKFSDMMRTSSFLEESIPRIIEVLWRCLITVGSVLPLRLCIARCLAQLVEEKLTHPVFSDMVRGVCELDPCTQVEILAACLPDSNDSFRYLLRLVESISPIEETLLDRASSRITKSVVSLLVESGGMFESEYQDMIWSWYLQNGHHLRFIFHLSKPLSLPIRCTFRVEALRFYLDRFGGPDNISTEDLCCVLEREMCKELAESANRASVEIMISLIVCLLYPNTLFSLPNGLQRLHALLRCLRALFERQFSSANLNPINVEQPFLELLCSAVARLKEVRTLHLTTELSSSSGFMTELNKEDAGRLSTEENETMESILEDISVLGRCVSAENGAPCIAGCPMWILLLSQAVDDRDRRECIKRAVFMN
ncbi:unnamed protein product [Phytomonas sp. Hart1]|nr:unnamed protein product [Phytomonas sp. Hart1]|eukprot:CCW67230.1 unnamed protein product [Phytomonas sp. isolate Hart1]